MSCICLFVDKQDGFDIYQIFLWGSQVCAFFQQLFITAHLLGRCTIQELSSCHVMASHFETSSLLKRFPYISEYMIPLQLLLSFSIFLNSLYPICILKLYPVYVFILFVPFTLSCMIGHNFFSIGHDNMMKKCQIITVF